MPPKDYWESLFEVDRVLDEFDFSATTSDVAELGCGYGTFTVPLAKRIRGNVYTIDLEPEMVAITNERAKADGLSNVQASQRDVLVDGFGIASASCDACLLFNILHAENPVALLRVGAAVVRPGGLIAVIHWRSDIPTPRGPPLEIRPTPSRIIAWAEAAGGLSLDGSILSLPPWHFGLKLRRSS